MRVSNSASLVALSCFSNIDSTLGFTLNPKKMSVASTTTQLAALTHTDILNRARKAIGQPEIEEEPQIFDDNILDDFQAVLLILEKRVKEGPSSLSVGEIEEFEIMTTRIVSEHRHYLNNGGKPLDKGISTAKSNTPVVGTSSPLYTAPNGQPGGEAKPLVEGLPAATGSKEFEHNPEEGAAFDGSGGLGLAKGTTNTWVIPGMDEMTGEEYRKALQESVSARQSQRKAGQVTGNRSSNNYLENL